MGIDYSRAGVSRGRVADETAPKTTVDLTWARSRRDQVREPPVAATAGPVTFVIEGSTAVAGATTVDLAHGGMLLTDEAPGVPTPVNLTLDSVAVSFIADSTPAGDWTLVLQTRNAAAGEVYFYDAATFDFATS